VDVPTTILTSVLGVVSAIGVGMTTAISVLYKRQTAEFDRVIERNKVLEVANDKALEKAQRALEEQKAFQSQVHALATVKEREAAGRYDP